MAIDGKPEILVLVVYDIRSPRRLAKMGKRLKDFGVRVQNSVFECRLREGAYARLREVATGIVDSRVDSLRFYRICSSCLEKAEFLGAEIPGLLGESIVI